MYLLWTSVCFYSRIYLLLAVVLISLRGLSLSSQELPVPISVLFLSVFFWVPFTCLYNYRFPAVLMHLCAHWSTTGIQTMLPLLLVLQVRWDRIQSLKHKCSPFFFRSRGRSGELGSFLSIAAMLYARLGQAKCPKSISTFWCSLRFPSGF